MFFWIRYVQSLLQTLNADTSPNEIAAGFVIGAIFGLVPKANLIGLILWLILWVFRVNKGMAGSALLIFAIVGHFTDPLAEQLGYWLLTGVPALKGLWTVLYNTPIVPYTSFNHTLVMGNLALGLILAAPLFLLMKKLVPIYRERYRERVQNSKIMKAFSVTNWVDTLERWKNRHG